MVSNRIGFRVKPKDEKLLYELATYLERTPSDTVRFAIRELARQQGLLSDKKEGQKIRRSKADKNMPPP